MPLNLKNYVCPSCDSAVPAGQFSLGLVLRLQAWLSYHGGTAMGKQMCIVNLLTAKFNDPCALKGFLI